MSVTVAGNNGTPSQRFHVLHKKLVHLIVVREELDQFAPLHPEVDASGMITIEFALPKCRKGDDDSEIEAKHSHLDADGKGSPATVLSVKQFVWFCEDV